MIFEIRQAEEVDEDRLLQWRRDPASLAASLSDQRPPSPEAHRAWLTERLHDPRTQIWIIEGDKIPVGQVRFETRGSKSEVSISIDEMYRGSGAARAGLLLAIKEVIKSWPDLRIIAKVRNENTPSRRLFESCGFVLEEQASSFVTYATALDKGDRS